MAHQRRHSYYLPLPPLSHTLPPAPEYRLPKLISTYSHLPDRSIVHNDESMTYYRAAPIGCDLSTGFERRIERDEVATDEHLDGLCESLWETWKNGRKAERRGGVITWRGMITRIMTAPFEDREQWEMTAVALDGSVYIELHDPPDVRKQRRNKQSAWAKESYMGYAFESFSTTTTTTATNTSSIKSDDVRDEDIPEGWGGDVNTNVQWCNIVRSAIGEIPLCLGGEVDCVRAEVGSPHPGLDHCVELKTNKVINDERGDAVFHKKLLKHWAQSWLLGVPEIQVGFKDENGIIRSQKGFEVEKIPQMISSLPNPPWSPTSSHHFLHAVLSHVLTHVLPTDPCLSSPRLSAEGSLPPAQVWRFSFVPRRGCELFFVGEVGIENGRWGGVLPVDYVKWRMGLSAVQNGDGGGDGRE